jgi:hypothetical protein
VTGDPSFDVFVPASDAAFAPGDAAFANCPSIAFIVALGASSCARGHRRPAYQNSLPPSTVPRARRKSPTIANAITPVEEIRVDQHSFLIAASAHRDLRLHPVSGHFDSDVWTKRPCRSQFSPDVPPKSSPASGDGT